MGRRVRVPGGRQCGTLEPAVSAIRDRSNRLAEAALDGFFWRRDLLLGRQGEFRMAIAAVAPHHACSGPTQATHFRGLADWTARGQMRLRGRIRHERDVGRSAQGALRGTTTWHENTILLLATPCSPG